MKPNLTKILEAILHVIATAEKSGRRATQFDIAKTVFLADYRHLQSYGRPVTFDNFVAMKYGPVPSLTYDMLKSSFGWPTVGLSGPPWKSREISPTTREYFAVKRPANLRKLSESDVAALNAALSDVQAMGFKKTSDFTHRLPAYLKAWESRGESNSNPMDLRVLLPDFDDETFDDLEHASKHLSV
jgi:hypothetical protein